MPVNCKLSVITEALLERHSWSCSVYIYGSVLSRQHVVLFIWILIFSLTDVRWRKWNIFNTWTLKTKVYLQGQNTIKSPGQQGAGFQLCYSVLSTHFLILQRARLGLFTCLAPKCSKWGRFNVQSLFKSLCHIFSCPVD